MRKISLDAINTINSKLGQADAIATLLMLECDADIKINDDLRSYVLCAVSDLISDSKKLFRAETERKEQKSENK